jgi:hypothetical protein
MKGFLADADQLDLVKENLFPASRAAIGDWNKLPWHRRKRNYESGAAVEVARPNFQDG